MEDIDPRILSPTTYRRIISGKGSIKNKEKYAQDMKYFMRLRKEKTTQTMIENYF